MSPIGISFVSGAVPITMPGSRVGLAAGTSWNDGTSPLMTPCAAMFDAVSVPWPSMAGS